MTATHNASWARRTAGLLLAWGLALGVALLGASAATASPATSGLARAAAPVGVAPAPVATAMTATATDRVVAAAPAPPAPPAEPEGPTVAIDINGINGKPSDSMVIIIAITLLSVAPALLLMTTAFTKVFVVLSITRNALGLQAVPPNQVIAGLALFLSLFIMSPVLGEMNDTGVQPYLRGELAQAQAFDTGVQPLREFMVQHTRSEDLALISRAADRPNPESWEDTPLTTLIPAFVLSELRAGFIIGFVIFIPFLIIDMVVSAALMSMGMMMLPPITVSLPFKLLLFVLVDGWSLIIQAIVGSY